MHARLTLFSGPRVVLRRPLRRGERIVLGRDASAEIRLEGTFVSRRHAQVLLGPDGITVTDLGSRNGTFLGPDRLHADMPVLLEPGQLVRVADYTFTVELEADQESALAERYVQHDMPPLPPDEFEILGEIGRGAKGVVWAARQLILDRMVAVKVLRSELDPELADHERFLREARLYCRARSPYVVELYDVRFAQGQPCLIMELVTGQSAVDRLERGPLLVPEALKIAEDVARALAVLARVGVIHRDVKPDNILVGADGVAKLGDFGIAMETDAALGEGDVGLGSIPYISPEQVLGDRVVDTRADLYGLGATLYTLIARQTPFEQRDAADITELLDEIVNEEPPPLSALRPDCPYPVEVLVHRLMDKEPDARLQPAAYVAGKLEEIRTLFYPDWGPSRIQRGRAGSERPTRGMGETHTDSDVLPDDDAGEQTGELTWKP